MFVERLKYTLPLEENGSGNNAGQNLKYVHN